MFAARAAWNSAPTIVTTASSTISRASGTPGTAIAATSRPLTRSVPIVTPRRGSRSARPDSKIPPKKFGTRLAVNVTAASSGDRVRSYTSTVSATRAS
jgi:hypothetical protein